MLARLDSGLPHRRHIFEISWSACIAHVCGGSLKHFATLKVTGLARRGPERAWDLATLCCACPECSPTSMDPTHLGMQGQPRGCCQPHPPRPLAERTGIPSKLNCLRHNLLCWYARSVPCLTFSYPRLQQATTQLGLGFSRTLEVVICVHYCSQRMQPTP